MISYAQNFEDVMLERAFAEIENGFYVDVGAWDPDLDSVTRYFYERGWRGVNIEPNPKYLALLKEKRARDVNLGLAVGAHNGRAVITLIRLRRRRGECHQRVRSAKIPPLDHSRRVDEAALARGDACGLGAASTLERL